MEDWDVIACEGFRATLRHQTRFVGKQTPLLPSGAALLRNDQLLKKGQQ